MLWVTVVLLLVRGVGAVLASEPRAAGPVGSSRSAVVWPDDEARSFAGAFARAYLTYSPRDAEEYAVSLGRFMPGELVDAAQPRFASTSAQRVSDASVARVSRLDARRAVLTVQVSVAGESAGRYLAVPVARDSRGGLQI